MIKTLLQDEWRFLTFRSVSPSLQTHWKAYLAFGLLFTWLAGIGRYWDNPRAEMWQHLGLGSLAYIFALSLILWLLLAPLRPRNWSYRNVLLFTSLTSPPALLYAIPVERFVSPDTAVNLNMLFLAVVAIWRVALLARFLRHVAGLSSGVVVLATLLPLALIIVSLALLNLEHVVFDIMGGLRPGQGSPHDGAYALVFLLAILSFYASPVLAFGYILCVLEAWSRRDDEKTE